MRERANLSFKGQRYLCVPKMQRKCHLFLYKYSRFVGKYQCKLQTNICILFFCLSFELLRVKGSSQRTNLRFQSTSETEEAKKKSRKNDRSTVFVSGPLLWQNAIWNKEKFEMKMFIPWKWHCPRSQLMITIPKRRQPLKPNNSLCNTNLMHIHFRVFSNQLNVPNVSCVYVIYLPIIK